MIRALILLLVIVCAAPALAKKAPVAATGTFVDLPKFGSVNIGSSHVTIWLPPGYARGKQRYGVVYMQDAENLFFLKKSNFNKIWAADKSVMRLVAAKQIDPVIIVGIYSHGTDRARTYMPQRVYESLSPAVRAYGQSFVQGPIRSDAYLKFLTAELKPMIDKQYRTKPDREHTAIVGSSMGGLISLYAIAEYPQVFGKAGCVSTHWPLIDPIRADENRAEINGVWTKYLTERLGPAAGRYIWFDHGDQTLDQYYGPWQTAVDATLIRVGWRPQQDYETRSYPGTAHEENAWNARLDEIFGWLLGAHVND